MTVDRRRGIVAPDHPTLSIVRQCELLSISRSGFYFEPTGESAETLALMRLIDEASLVARGCRAAADWRLGSADQWHQDQHGWARPLDGQCFH